MWEAGALGFKGFLTERPNEQILNAGRLIELFEEIKSFDGVALIHAEDDSILKVTERRLKAAGRNDYRAVDEWRSRESETSAVIQVIQAAKAAGARAVIAHVSLPDLVDEVWRARSMGSRIYTETCPQYFTLTLDDVVKNGPYNKFTPPARGEEEVEGIWKRLQMSRIDMVNSDHCPHERGSKDKGLQSVWEAPFGIPGVETTTRLLLDGTARGKLPISEVARVRSENAARIYGLADKKGFIQAGYDADLIIVDLEKKETLTDAGVVSKCGWTPYRGRTVQGDVVLTMVRGNVVMEGGEVIGRPGWGRFVTRGR
jgi:dihydroorotase-like cyclic amidohydrolase